jgi:HSP20 family protein
MAEAATKLPIKEIEKSAKKTDAPAPMRPWHPFESLHSEIDRLFDDFGRNPFRLPFGRGMFDVEPFWRREPSWTPSLPAVDVVEDDKAYRIAAELPGMDEKNIDLTLSDDELTIRGEKKEETEEKQKDYCLSERRYGSFERSFRLPEGVDRDKIEANFAKGVLTVVLPKAPGAQPKYKKIAVKAA